MENEAQSGFAGFQKNSSLTPIPVDFFQELLPQIDHLGEMKVTLYAFWALAQQKGSHPHLRRSSLLQDEHLAEALDTGSHSADEALDEALERAVQRGTLLAATSQSGEDSEQFYFLNAPKGRQTMEALRAGKWRPEGLDPQARLQAGRPNIFVLYEQNIGALTPLLAERLHEAEEEYPPGWIKDAIKIAVANNVRKWRYIEAILEDWKTKGRDDQEDRRDLEETRRRYLGGEFAEYIKH